MSSFETSGTVEEHGRVLVAMDDEALAGARRRMRELFRTIKGFRNYPG